MAVSDATFGEGVFDTSTFDNISRSESVAVDDTAEFDASLFRRFDALVNVQDADTIFPSRQFSESVSPADSRELSFSRGLSETQGLVDAIFRTIQVPESETVDLGDSLTRSISLLSTEDVKFNNRVAQQGGAIGSVPQDAAFNTGRFGQMSLTTLERDEEPSIEDALALSLGRRESEQLSVSDVLSPFINKTFDESLTLTDADERLIDISIDQQIAFDENVQDLKSLFRRQTVQLDVTAEQSFTLTLTDLVESFSQSDRAVFRLNRSRSESVSAADSVERLGNFRRLPAESVNLSDVSRTRLDKPLGETAKLEDSEAFSLFRSEQQQVGIGDELSFTFSRAVAEQLQAVDAIVGNTGIFLTASESLGLSTNLAKQADLFRRQSEAIVPDDSFDRVLDLFRQVEAQVGPEDAESFALFRQKSESTDIQDRVRKSPQLLKQETVDVTDQVETVADLFRRQTATVDLIDSDVRNIDKPLRETVVASDRVLREADLFRRREESVGLDSIFTLRYLVFLNESFSPRDDVLRVAEYRRARQEVVKPVDELGFLFSRLLEESVSFDLNVGRFINIVPQQPLRVRPSVDVRQIVGDIPARAIVEFVGTATQEAESR